MRRAPDSALCARPAILHRRLSVIACLLAIVLSGLAPGGTTAVARQARTDLDEFMARVIARRDESWKTLQQYVLQERETVRITGPGTIPIYGSQREYIWFPRDGVFVRSPVRVDGVTLDETARRRGEKEWLQREDERARRRARAEPSTSAEPAEAGAAADVVRQSIEPAFVSAAYFLRFRFDPGQYALVGRERLDGQDVLHVEYYPTMLFRDRSGRGREGDPELPVRMNKTSLVTLWIAPDAHQILQYEFENVDLDFLPGRALVRLDGLHASMRMHEAFPGVWLPQSIAMRFDLMTAASAMAGEYDVVYHDYRLADVTMRVR